MSPRLLTRPPGGVGLCTADPVMLPPTFLYRRVWSGSSVALRSPTAYFFLSCFRPPTHCVSCLKGRASAFGLCFYENGQETPRTLALHLGPAVFHVPP